jgi:anti-sigma regulatory factor (Ser/Thr protein kinase)
MSNLKNKWDGVLQIIPNLQWISSDSLVRSQAILDLRVVLNELAVNAVKHGGAYIFSVDKKIE